MVSQLATVRRFRIAGSVFAGLAAIALAAAMVLNENAVNLAGRVSSDAATYWSALALAVALVAAALDLRSAARPGARGIAGPVGFTILAVCLATLAAYLIILGPVAANICPVPVTCVDPVVPESDYRFFYPAVLAALAAAGLSIVAGVLLIIGRGGPTRPHPGRPGAPT